jgi:hypothetical protein
MCNLKIIQNTEQYSLGIDFRNVQVQALFYCRRTGVAIPQLDAAGSIFFKKKELTILKEICRWIVLIVFVWDLSNCHVGTLLSV